MALTNATTLADYSAGIGTQGAALTVDATNKRVGVGTDAPAGPEGSLQVGTGITFFGNTGIISATGGKFSGDFSVAGALTFEDVTNIDSLGFGTFRSGLIVQGAGSTTTTLSVTGVSTFASNVSIADSIFHTGDTDTSIRFPAANTFTVETGGSERIRVDSSGNFGVGTNNPGFDLEVVDSSGDCVIALQSPNSSNTEILFGDPDSSYSGRIRYGHSTNHLQFNTNASERVRITSDGELFVGTTSGDSTYQTHIKHDTFGLLKLETTNTSTDGSYLVLYHNSSSPADDDQLGIISFIGENDADEEIAYAQIRGFSGDVTDGTEDGYITFNTRAAGSFGERLRITSTGNVGINETSPTDFLHILPTDGKGITLKTTANHRAQITADCNRSAADNTILAIRGNWNGTGAAEIALTTGDDTANKDDGKILFKTSPSSGNIVQRMEINRLGQLLINTGDSTFNSRSGFFNDNGGSATAVQIEGSLYAYSSMSITRNGSGASGPVFILAKGQGGTTIINDNDTMGHISFQGAEGTGDMVEGAKIIAEVDGSPASNNMPGRLAFYTNSGTSSATERLRIDSSGRLLVGTTSARTDVSTTAQMQLEGTSQATSTFSVVRNSNDAGRPTFVFGKTRGTSDGAVTVVNDNDLLGVIEFLGSDGTDLNRAAFISAEVDGTPGTDDMPGALTFSTSADGSNSPTERLRITSAGIVRSSSTGIDGSSLTIDLGSSVYVPGFQAKETSGAAQALSGYWFNHGGLNAGMASTRQVTNQWGTDLRFYTHPFATSNQHYVYERFRIDPDGRIFIRDLLGNASSGSAVKYSNSDDELRYDTSSKLLKTNITECPYGIETVKKLKPSRYTPQEYDKEGNINVTDEVLIGFIAEEMVEEVPEVVQMYAKSTLTRNDEDTEIVPAAISYDKLTAVLTKALQEAIAKIETLEAAVAALQG